MSTAATASVATGYYYGTYATSVACAADGSAPITGGYYYECVETWDGWDRYIYY